MQKAPIKVKEKKSACSSDPNTIPREKYTYVRKKQMGERKSASLSNSCHPITTGTLRNPNCTKPVCQKAPRSLIKRVQDKKSIALESTPSIIRSRKRSSFNDFIPLLNGGTSDISYRSSPMKDRLEEPSLSGRESIGKPSKSDCKHHS